MKLTELPVLAGGSNTVHEAYTFFLASFCIISGPIPVSHSFSRSPAVAEPSSATYIQDKPLARDLRPRILLE